MNCQSSTASWYNPHSSLGNSVLSAGFGLYLNPSTSNPSCSKIYLPSSWYRQDLTLLLSIIPEKDPSGFGIPSGVASVSWRFDMVQDLCPFFLSNPLKWHYFKCG